MRHTSGTCSTPLGRFRSSLQASRLEDYLLDRKLQLAVERAIEIIGEAARLVSPELKAQHPGIPWRQIVSQRNVLAHDYGEIKQDRIWLVATSRIPDLIAQLQPLLPGLDAES